MKLVVLMKYLENNTNTVNARVAFRLSRASLMHTLRCARARQKEDGRETRDTNQTSRNSIKLNETKNKNN